MSAHAILLAGVAVFVLGSAADVLSSLGIGRGRLASVREKNPLWARADGTFRALRNVLVTGYLLALALVYAGAFGRESYATAAVGLAGVGIVRGAVAVRNVRIRRRAARWPSA